MRSLSSTLTAAQKASKRTPYLEVKAYDRVGSVLNLRWTTLYSGTETDNNHALAILSDGSVNRLRIDGTTLYRQRRTDPQNWANNVGFENWSGGNPVYWSSSNGALVTQEATEKRSGSYAMRIEGAGSYRSMEFQIPADVVPLLRGKTVTFTCWAKTNRPPSSARLQITDSAGNTQGTSHTGSGNWEQLTVTRTIDAAATFIDIRCFCGANVGAGQYVYFDDCFLAETTANPFAAWTSWRTATRNCAIAKSGSTLIAFAVDNTTPTQLYESTSTDGGDTWSAWTLAFTHTEAITYLAAAAKSATTYVVIVNSTTHIAAYKKSAGAWAAAVISTTNVNLTGLAIHYGMDFNVVLTGTKSAAPTDSVLAQQIFGDGYSAALNTWDSRVDILTASTGTNVTYSRPFLTNPDVYRLYFREAFTGTGAYDRIMWTYSLALSDFVNAHWHEPIPRNETTTYGLALDASSTYAWLTRNSKVYRAPLTETALDLTANIVEARYHEEQYSQQPAKILLDNSAGTYNNPGSGAIDKLKLGAEVRIAPGYVTSAGNESSAGISLWITNLEHIYDSKGKAFLAIEAAPAWTLIDRWRTNRAQLFTAKNGSQHTTAILARAGLSLIITNSSTSLTSYSFDFAVLPPTPGLTALRNLRARYSDVLLVRASLIYNKNPLATDASGYAYHFDVAGQHPIMAATYTQALKAAAHFQLIGNAALGESIDFTEVDRLHSVVHQAYDKAITTELEADRRASADDRHATIASRHDRIVAPVHAGLEAWDVIDITDRRQGLTAAKRRVIAIDTIYQRGQQGARYEQILTLGEP